MKKFTSLQAFEVIPVFLLLYAKAFSDFRELGPIILSSMCIFTWEDKRPAVMSTWYDWKKAVQQILDNNVHNEKNDETFNPFITWEQGFIAAFFFLNDYYWKKNNKISIEEVLHDLTKTLELKIDVFHSNVWKTWMKKVKKSLEYNLDYDS